MGRDIPHAVRRGPRVVERQLHGPPGALGLGGQGREVEGVGRGAVARELGVDAGAAAPGVLELLEHEDDGALPDHEAVAVGVVRAGGLLRGVIAG